MQTKLIVHRVVTDTVTIIASMASGLFCLMLMAVLAGGALRARADIPPPTGVSAITPTTALSARDHRLGSYVLPGSGGVARLAARISPDGQILWADDLSEAQWQSVLAMLHRGGVTDPEIARGRLF